MTANTKKFRVTPARRKVSAKYGKPPTFGRIAMAFLLGSLKFFDSKAHREFPSLCM